MHSSLVRVQTVFGFFTTVAFAVAAVVALSVLASPQSPTANVKLRNVQVVKGRPHYYSSKKEEYAHLKFDLDADFTSLFDWNTKQLFVYILATYPSSSPSSPPSQAIIWDLIIPSTAQTNPPAFLEYLDPKNLVLPFSGGKSTKAAKTAKGKSKSPSKRDSKTKTAGKAPPPISPGLISLKNTRAKYQITDISGKLADKGNVTLEIGWNIQPWVGALTWTRWQPFGRWAGVRGGRSATFDFPALKGSKKVETPVSVEDVPQPGAATPIV